jgi:hypothetical protein
MLEKNFLSDPKACIGDNIIGFYDQNGNSGWGVRSRD